MAKYLVEVTELVEDNPEPSGSAFIVFLSIILYFPLRYSVSAIANHFWIPVFGWYFMDSAVVFWALVVLNAILIFVILINSDHPILILIAFILLFSAFLIVPRVVGLKPVLTREAASETFEYNPVGRLKIYKTNEPITLENGEVIPQATEFFCEKIDKGEYTVTFKGIAVLNNSFVSYEIKFEKSHFPLEEMKVTEDNAQSYYSINVFKSLINSIYKKYSSDFINELLSKGIYPKEHESSDFFKEDVKKNGGVLLDGKWFDNDFSEKDSLCFYFESESDYKSFKKIYNKQVSSFNKECYEATSAIGKAFSSYGMGSRK